MDLQAAFGLTDGRTIRYAMVGLGDISQEALLPGVRHTGNSEITAFVTDDAEKGRELGDRYDVTNVYDYANFAQMLASGTVDAIYLATPNWRHAEFVIPALDAGIHVLVEKPLEVSTEKCNQIIAAQRRSKAKLMVAYRLHFEPATLALLDVVRSGTLGDVHSFTSTFAQMVSPQNHRAQSGDLAGPVLDMGPYPVNAARAVFGTEPISVSAVGSRHPEAGFGDFDDTVAVTLEFPQGRLAQFVVSYYGNALDTYTVVGTKGSAQMNPGYMYGKPLERSMIVGEEKTHERSKNTDHFGGELKYFSDCIMNDTLPEPGVEEGFADVRVLEAILQALKTGTAQKLSDFAYGSKIDTAAQLQTLAPQRSPELVHASNPGRGKDKIPLN